MGVPLRRAPTRTCVACRTERQKRDLLRVVRRPDGAISIDPTGKLAGRGAYLCADGACWSVALRRRSLERALDASLPAELRERLTAGDPTLIEGGARGT